VAQRWVIGAEGEIAPGISTADFSLDWTAALRGRVGYLLTPSTMVFGSAGWLTSGIRTSSVVGGAVVIPSQRVNGAQIGGGIETAVTEHWLARFDYQYAFTTSLHDVTFNFTPFGTTGTVDARAQAHCGRLALVYLYPLILRRRAQFHAIVTKWSDSGLFSTAYLPLVRRADASICELSCSSELTSPE
jgi:outer membrane immunogenic protein